MNIILEGEKNKDTWRPGTPSFLTKSDPKYTLKSEKLAR